MQFERGDRQPERNTIREKTRRINGQRQNKRCAAESDVCCRVSLVRLDVREKEGERVSVTLTESAGGCGHHFGVQS